MKADLHIHSCLSPCASLDMSPSAIVQRLLKCEIDICALTDHNTARNCPTMSNLCAQKGILFVPGMEVASIEEAHVLCLFEKVETALEFDQIVYSHLPDVKNIPEKFGDQVIVNELDEIEGELDKYLGMATDLSLSQLQTMVFERGGLFIPAHIDKPVFSVISQLGFLGKGYSAVEVTKAAVKAGHYLEITDSYPVITNSDAHYLHDIAGAFSVVSVCRSFTELKQKILSGSCQAKAFSNDDTNGSDR